MTDRFHSLTVFLDKDIREDDAEPLLAAIRMIRGVRMVVGEVADPASAMAEFRARQEARAAIIKLLDTEFPQ